MAHLVIIDGHAIAHRAYHSIPSLSFNGQPVNAIYGFYSMILSSIDQLKPDYLLVCLDSPGPNFRNIEFLGYRARRQPADHDLISQLPKLPETLESAGIPNIAMGGFEADDLIATLTRRSQKVRRRSDKKHLFSKITIITGDKDLMQLVNQKVSLFVPVRGLSETKTYDPGGVKEKLGVNPNQVIDLKALMGDMSDNYPGVTGIGPKTAVDLLTKYQNLDNIYTHLDEISENIREKLIKDKNNAYLSQKLATLVSNISLKFNFKSARLNQDKYLGLLSLFEQYNFKSLSSRLKRKLNLSPLSSKGVVRRTGGFNPNQSSLF
ncbi:MAG TPA: 5'-3' exonuclease H3TH domain-containing protein [Candidatus Woesebacteria bacterium]|nr:5'-3' exonuclease H3TH domain-containing protein [Candidatus Woesebacteria bacterium]HPR99364.1 5'-3' exonuclease H3TH domain-containing protein [Candidatus Woesebacteria bacterium]